MAANVETMFYTRETPWHGLGTKVANSPTSQDALRLAGLDWKVLQEPIYTENGEKIEGFKANVRDSDRRVLGVEVTPVGDEDEEIVLANTKRVLNRAWALVED